MMQTQNRDGANGQKYGDLEATVRKQLDKLRKPGRPSNEVLELRAQLAELEGQAKPEPKEVVIKQRGKKIEQFNLERGPVQVPEIKKSKKTSILDPETEKQSRRTIYIPSIIQEVIEVEVEGITDLIQHAWDPKTVRQMEEQQQKKVGDPKTRTRNAQEPRDPKAEYTAARYVRNGKDKLPVVQFKKCMAAAASQLKGVNMRQIYTSVFILSTDPNDIQFAVIKHNSKEPVLRTDMVKIGKFPNKVATPRYRPGYIRWSTTIRIQFDSSIISAEQIATLLDRGGFGFGIAEWRPERGGEFGRFRVKNVRGV